MDILEQIDNIPDPVVADKARKAIQVLRRTCALYPLDKIAFSFNGGKDSTVLLHLLRAAVAQLSGGKARGLGGIQSFYFRNADDFTEVKDFVGSSDALYGLAVQYLTEPDFKRGLSDYLAGSGVMAIVLGTRRGDPNGGSQDVFCPSSDGWPPFMRVNPIIDWTYHDVWVFLRAVRVPYCSLYDHGYTSLGGTGNTLPNSALRRAGGGYEPAYKLADGRLERVGRVHPAKPGAAATATTAAAAAARPHPQPHPPTPSIRVPAAAAAQEGPVPAVLLEGKDVSGQGLDQEVEVGITVEVNGGGGAAEAAEAAAEPRGGSGGGGGGAGGCGGHGGLTHSAAIVIIGDELLSGKVEDTNARFLCRELRALGWQVTRVVFVPDDVDEIASAVRALAAVVQVVITAGGIGPTLDDVTMQGVARAVGQPLVRLPGMVERLSSYFGGPAALTPAHLKMAEAPQLTQLIDYALPDSAGGGGGGTVSKFPLMRVNNIYVLPGVPSLLVEKWGALRPRLQEAALPPFRNATLRLSLTDETAIAPALVRVASSQGLDVAVGSYPVDHGIIITLDSKNSEKLEAAIQEITELLPGEAVVALERDVDSIS